MAQYNTKRRKKGKKSSGKMICKNTNNKQEESHNILFPLRSIAPFSPPFIFHQGRYQTQMCGERKGERGENNYPLPQPAGLFINTQL